jgi:hypothetical protein
MTPAESVVSIFRSDTRDIVAPYLWSDDELYEYLSDAYQTYVRLSGGIPDFVSDELVVSVTAADRMVDLHPAILRVINAFRSSDGVEVITYNLEDVGTTTQRSTDDYGLTRSRMMANQPGEVRYMVLGVAPDKAMLVDTPIVDDELNLYVMRMPFDIEVTNSSTLPDVPARHHRALTLWMKYRGYNKQDADTFDPKAAAAAGAEFSNYCSAIEAETARKMTKPRVVAYGGI